MPWTLVHPAAVLPLRKFCVNRLSFAGLVVGSVSPDIGYYVGRFDLAAIAHTTLGLMVLCLPTGLALFALTRILHEPVADLLPQPHRSALLSVPKMPRLTSVRTLFYVSISIVTGATTHNAWDSFTHGTGFLVTRLPLLRTPVIALGSRAFRVFELLQHASTALGLAVVLIVYVRWVRGVDCDHAMLSTSSDRWRYRLLAAITLISLVIAMPFAYLVSMPNSGKMNVSLLIVRYVVSSTTIFAITLSVISLLIYTRPQDA